MNFLILKALAADDINKKIIEELGNAIPGLGRYGNIFTWSLGVGGLLALGIIVHAGILYIASAGNASKQTDAKDRITAAIYGLLLLIAGYMLLLTVNPAIVNR